MRSSRRSGSHKGGKDSNNKKNKQATGRKAKRKRGRKLLYTRFRSAPEPESTSPPRTPPSSDDEEPGPTAPPPPSMTISSKSFDTSAVLKTHQHPDGRPFNRSASMPSPSRATNDRRRTTTGESRTTSRLKTSATVAPVPNPQVSGSSFPSRGKTDRRSALDKKQSRRSKQRNSSSKRLGGGHNSDRMWADPPTKQARGALPRGVMYVAKNSQGSSKQYPAPSNKPRYVNHGDSMFLLDSGHLPPPPPMPANKQSVEKKDSKNKRYMLSAKQHDKPHYRKAKSKSEKRVLSRDKPKLSHIPHTTAPVPLPRTAQAPPRPQSSRTNNATGGTASNFGSGAHANQLQFSSGRSASLSDKMLGGNSNIKTTRAAPLHFASPALSATEVSSITSCSNLSSLGVTPQRTQAYSPARSHENGNTPRATLGRSQYEDVVDDVSESDTTESDVLRVSAQAPWPPHKSKDITSYAPARPPSPRAAPSFHPPAFSPARHASGRITAKEARSDGVSPPPNPSPSPQPAATMILIDSKTRHFPLNERRVGSESTTQIEEDISDKMSPTNRHYVQHHLDVEAECMYNNSNTLSSIPNEYSRVTPQQAYHKFLESTEEYDTAFDQYHHNPYMQYMHSHAEQAPMYTAAPQESPYAQCNPQGYPPQYYPQQQTYAHAHPQSNQPCVYEASYQGPDGGRAQQTSYEAHTPKNEHHTLDDEHCIYSQQYGNEMGPEEEESRAEDDTSRCLEKMCSYGDLDKENKNPSQKKQDSSTQSSLYEIESVYDLDRSTSMMRGFGRASSYQSPRTEKVLIEGTEKSFFVLESLGGSVYDPLWENTATSPQSLGPIKRPEQTQVCRKRLHMRERRLRRSQSESSVWMGTLMSGLSLAPALSCLYDAEM